ncbi:hypothetical protein KAX35_07885, partial [candidate division WOR-3 bacterium]|nr:hypothetical protein [candidate division WOR-3 bacterium]
IRLSVGRLSGYQDISRSGYQYIRSSGDRVIRRSGYQSEGYQGKEKKHIRRSGYQSHSTGIRFYYAGITDAI